MDFTLNPCIIHPRPMKTHVIRLERYDDLISTQDKMSWSKVPRILLVWPQKGSPLSQRVDLVILQRYSQKLGSQLALVTFNKEVVDNARQIGIPVFESITEAQRKPWRRNRRRRNEFDAERIQAHKRLDDLGSFFAEKQPKTKTPLPVRILAVTVVVLVLVALVLFFIPGTTIRLSPKQEDQSIILKVWASTALSTPNVMGGIPAKEKVIAVEGEEVVISSGRQVISDHPAGGVVQFTNLTTQEVKIPAGTVVRTMVEPAMRYKTLEEITVPVNGDQTAETFIQAVQAGSSSNVDPHQINGIEGLLGTYLAVDNLQEVAGGSDRETPSPTDADYQAARKQLLEKLQKNVLDELNSNHNGVDLNIPATIKVKEIISEERTPKEGLPGDRLSLKMNVKFSVWSSLAEDIKTVANMGLDAVNDQNVISVPDSLQIEPVGEVVLDGNRVNWELRATRRIRPIWSPEAVSWSLTGKKPQEAVKILQRDISLQKPPLISMQPAWWPILPFYAPRIQVVEE